MKMRIYLWMMIIPLICVAYKMSAQPYYYNGHNDDANVWRLNLQNNSKDLFYTDSINSWGDVSWDPTQQWVFIDINSSSGKYNEFANYRSASVVNTNSRITVHTFPDQNPSEISRNSFYWMYAPRGRVHDGIVFNPVKNVFYVTWFLPFSDTLEAWSELSPYQRTAVYDALTFTVLDTLPVSSGWITSLSSVSNDGNYLYVENFDYYDSKTITIGKYSLLTKQLIVNKNLSDVYVEGGDKDVDDSKKGKFLLQFLYPTLTLADKKYAVYDIDRDTTYAIIPFPPVSNGSISSDGKYVIIEETPVIPSPQDIAHMFYHPGRISVFNGVSGQLIQKLKLPPDGKVLVFDNYPNMLYYYLEKKQKSVNIDLSKLAAIGTITPQNVLVGSGAFTLSVSGKNFTPESKVRLAVQTGQQHLLPIRSCKQPSVPPMLTPL